MNDSKIKTKEPLWVASLESVLLPDEISEIFVEISQTPICNCGELCVKVDF